jgi:hypothetical protein
MAEKWIIVTAETLIFLLSIFLPIFTVIHSCFLLSSN